MAEPGGPSSTARRPEDPLPENWAEIDLARCFAEYTRHCRESFLRGDPVADLFTAKCQEAGR